MNSRTCHTSAVMLASLTLCALAIFPGVANANDSFEGTQETSLRQGLNLYGGPIEEISAGSLTTAGDDGIIYAALNSPNGIYYSTDNGDTWNGPSSDADFGTISSVAGSQTTPGLAFMIGGINLYRTQDSGATWEVLDGEDYGQTMTLGQDTLLVAYRDGTLHISNDAGETFDVVDVSGDSNATINDISAVENRLYVLSGEGATQTLYTLNTSDHNPFEATSLVGDYTYITAAGDNSFVIVSGNDGIQYSTDSGTSWSDMDPLNQVGNNADITISGANRVYIGLSYTDDFGSTWTSIRDSVTSTDSVLKADFVQFIGDYTFTKSGRGIARSSGDLTEWTDKIDGMNGVTIYDVAQDTSKEVVWLAGHGGFAKSENFYSSVSAGNTPTWEYPIYPDLDENGDSSIDYGSAVWIDPTDAEHVVVAWGSSVYLSPTGGATWIPMEVDLEPDKGGTARDIVESGDTLYLSYTYLEGDEDHPIGGGVVMSDDLGFTWTDLGMADVPAGPLTMDGNGNLIVGVGAENDDTASLRGLYMYNGTTWTNLTESSDHPAYQQMINDVAYIPSLDMLVATGGETNLGGAFYSTDSVDWGDWNSVEGLPEAFWGQGVTADSTAKNIYLSTARPAGTGTIYKCTNDFSLCALFYTGLKDEAFKTLQFDGLLSGSNAGMFAYQSQVDLQISKKQYAAGSENRLAGKVKIVAVLRDATMQKNLNTRMVKLYRRTKTGSFAFFQKTKTHAGKAIFVVNHMPKARWYEAHFAPKKAADVTNYPALKKSNVVKIKKLQ